jgi:multidrug efflux system outer membrane protein
MQDNSVTIPWRRFVITEQELHILRYAVGATLAMALAMGFDWFLSFLMPVLILSFLAPAATRPTLRDGLNFVLVIALACFIALMIARMLLPYPFVYIPLVGLILCRLYYAKDTSFPPLLILWLLIAILVIPMMGMQSIALANMVAIYIVIGAAVTMLIVWIAYGLLPSPDAKSANKLNEQPVKVAPPTKQERFKSAVESTTVVFPVLAIFYIFQLSGALIVLIFIALLSMQPGFAKDFKMGKALIAGNLIGGAAAILFYELLVIFPEYIFLVLLTLLAGLIFGSRLFSGKPAAPLYGMAFSTLLLVIGSTTGAAGEADVKVYTRILYIMMAVVYVVFAFGLIERFKDSRKIKKFGNKGLLLISLGLIVMNCTVGRNFQTPEVEKPETYQQDFPSDSSIANLAWWELFGDTVLQELIYEGLENNRDLGASLARIDEARANLGIVRADLYPRINYSADGSLDWLEGSEDNPSSDAVGAFNLSYELDLWGRIRRSNEAAIQDLLSTEEAYRGVTIALIAEVANSYFLLRDIDNRLLVSERTANAWRKSLEVIQAKYRAGIVSEVDVNQSEIQLADAEASVEAFKRIRSQTENIINLLLSKPPTSIARGLNLQEQLFPPEIPAGLPSDLLARRPDLLETERKLHAQTARIGVAEALKYPKVTLSADLGARFADVTSGFVNLGAQLFGPLFNSGENQRRVDVEVARTEQLLNLYEQAFFSALREVEDAMVAVNTYDAESRIRSRQVDAAESATELSWTRYEGGLTSYLEVLDVQRSLFTSQLKASETLQLKLTSTVRLYKALGGGWIPEQDSLEINSEE